MSTVLLHAMHNDATVSHKHIEPESQNNIMFNRYDKYVFIIVYIYIYIFFLESWIMVICFDWGFAHVFHRTPPFPSFCWPDTLLVHSGYLLGVLLARHSFADQARLSGMQFSYILFSLQVGSEDHVCKSAWSRQLLAMILQSCYRCWSGTIDFSHNPWSQEMVPFVQSYGSSNNMYKRQMKMSNGSYS